MGQTGFLSAVAGLAPEVISTAKQQLVQAKIGAKRTDCFRLAVYIVAALHANLLVAQVSNGSTKP